MKSMLLRRLVIEYNDEKKILMIWWSMSEFEDKTYFLKSKNRTIASFSLHKQEIKQIFDGEEVWESSYEIGDLQVFLPSLLPHDLQSNCTPHSLKKWIEKRKVPKNRAFVERIVHTYHSGQSSNFLGYVDVSLGFSLNDAFWISPAQRDYRWESYNLYTNPFDSMLMQVAFNGISHKATGLVTTPEYTTNGALRKCWRFSEGEVKLYKASSQPFANGGREAYGEYYTAQIAQAMGLECIAYGLEEFHGEIVSVCSLFTSEDVGFLPMYSCLPQEARGLKKFELLSEIQKIYTRETLADLMLFDALIYNTDRHLGNFGMLFSNEDNTFIKPAPIFDNGLCIFNFLTKDDLKNIKEALQDKVSSFDISFDQQLRVFLNKRHIPMLEKLTNFEFKKYPKFNLDDYWLDKISSFVQDRAKYAIELAKTKA